MAEGKKGFVLYADQKSIFDDLTNEEAGILIKHIFSYVNDENPTLEDRLIDMAFKPIKAQLKRDLVKYQSIKEKNSLNARKRWDAVASGGMPLDAKNADKDKDNVTDTVNDKVKVIVKENIDSRKLKFASTLNPFLQTYGKDLLNSFFKYWTEPNKSGSKFRQELEKTWSLERRLETWAKNDKNFNKGSPIENTFENRAKSLEEGLRTADWNLPKNE
ncbi:MAG: hypothetical protein QG594_591 [Bacteroidota bacterium]|jgi:hypothetical protein|nr:hypothetical protein [Bacteroidota bacterium]